MSHSWFEAFHSPGEYASMLLVPFGLILLGGYFVMADVVLLKRRGDADGVTSFVGLGSRPRPGLRFASVFFFTLASVLAARDLVAVLHEANPMVIALSIGLITTLLAFAILLLGILVPRGLGESLHESLPVRAVSRMARWLTIWIDPLADLCWICVSVLLHLLHLDRSRSAQETEDEVLQMMDEGLSSGAFDAAEREMVEGVLELDEQTAAELMTPRSLVTWLDLDDLDEVNWRRIAAAGHSDFPVFLGNRDNIRGMVSVKSLWANISLTGSVKLSDVVTPPLFVPASMSARRLIEEFRRVRKHVALVVDEFGVVDGMVTLKDVVEAIVGQLPERGVRQHYPQIILREDGSWIIDGQLDFEETAKEIKLLLTPEEIEANRYQTIGGYVLHHFGHIPEEGNTLQQHGFRFEIIDMDRQRIDKLLVTRMAPLHPATEESQD
jgi:putative hemolysin